jgi:hypothetical protein
MYIYVGQVLEEMSDKLELMKELRTKVHEVVRRKSASHFLTHKEVHEQ